MPTPLVTTILDPALLLERAVNGLFPLAPPTSEQPWPTLSAWVVLRQGGLRDDLHRLVAAKGVPGWFERPVCVFTEIVDRWSAEGAPAPLTEPERQAILSRVVECHGATLFGRSAGTDHWVPAVDRLIGELVSEGIEPDSFARALQALGTDTFSRHRADVLPRIYRTWLDTVALANRTDGRDGEIRLAREVAADPTGFAKRLGGRRDVRIVGLADLRGGWRHLIAALAESPAIDRLEIITSSNLDLKGIDTDCVDSPATTFAAALFGNGGVTAPHVRLIEAPDSAREVELVALRVRALLDEGVRPTRIAVVSREDRPLLGAMTSVLAKLGVPVTARCRQTLSHTAPARALRALLAVADSWSRHSVVELAEHPLLATGLNIAVVNCVGFAQQMRSRDDWREGFARLLARCVKRESGETDEADPRRPLPSMADVQSTSDAWNALDLRLSELAARPLDEWFIWTHETLRGRAWGLAEALARPHADREVWETDVRASNCLAEQAMDWHAALTQFGSTAEPVAANVFAERLALLMEEDLVTPPATDFGVVVGEALTAGWRAFDHTFVIGLSAGVFPQRPSAGGILDPEDRRALIAAGLPIDDPDAWRSREAALFRVVCAGPRESLTLSWPVMDRSGRDVARSAFVDEAAATLARARGLKDDDELLADAAILRRVPTNEALVPGFPVANHGDAISHARLAAARENRRTREPREPTAWNGVIEEPSLAEWLQQQYGESYVWSATQIEQVAKCRWHWFAQRLLKFDPQTDADNLMEPTVRGSVMHDALDRFFKAAARRIVGPVHLVNDDGRWASLMTKSLADAWSAAEAKEQWLGPPALRAAVRNELQAELQGYLKSEIAWNVKPSKQVRTGFIEGERKFGPVDLTVGGVSFKLSGSIDRVDRGVDDRIADASRYIAAIDYKSTKSAAPAAGNKKGWDDGVVLQVPLYAEALKQIYPDDLIARMEYRTLRKPELLHSLSLASVKNGQVDAAADAEAQLAAALEAAVRRVRQVRSGILPADPAKSCGCSPYCPAKDVCRIPGGPVEKE